MNQEVELYHRQLVELALTKNRIRYDYATFPIFGVVKCMQYERLADDMFHNELPFFFFLDCWVLRHLTHCVSSLKTEGQGV